MIFFLAMFEKKIGQKPGKSSPAVRCSGTLSQSIGRGRMISRDSGGSPGCSQESRNENDVTKFSPKQNTPFWHTKNQIFRYHYQKHRKSSFQWEISKFLAAEIKPTFVCVGGYNFKTGLPVSILGHIQAWANLFLAQNTSVILKKGVGIHKKILKAASL